VPLPLAIVLLAGDMARGAILCRDNPGTLLFRHDAIGLCPVFHLVDVFLLLIQPVCFSLVQLPTRNPLIDPLFLIRLPLIDDRRIRLGKRRSVDAEYQSADCKRVFFITASLKCGC